ncbi:hypothetical protein TrRE_jg5829 [Triparma retinervis]|uniref:Pyrroline-5-carboxylate reductase catalytic N-terminal domain-containing protein n=1 Tax=Triparma retinervis TaxID=2557542 RepID=A0A9W6ZBC1_9STRA|nr:hypothetical protein TrRE_jg5829 [Triparma retinervis]
MDSKEADYDPTNPPPASSAAELLDPKFVMRSLSSLLTLPEAMDLSSVSRRDSSVVIRSQVLFLVGAILASIKDCPNTYKYDQPAVGIIGCGLIGSNIINAMIASGLPPHSILIASRDEQKVARFRALGCRSGTDTAVVESCRAIVLCVAPQHLRALGSEVRKLKKKSRCVVISTVAGVSSGKIAKLCGISKVVRTVVDLVQLPVAWGGEEGGDPGGEAGLTDDMITVGAKNLVAQAGALREIQAAIESLALGLGAEPEEARRDATMAIVGERDTGESPIKRPRVKEEEEGKGEREEEGEGGREVKGEGEGEGEKDEWIEEAPKPFLECADFLKYWKDNVAKGFWEVIAEEVYVKDLVF